ncbi:hypothetical protein CsSME_00031538 [Camellia sinensis var. sinensis]
MGPYDASMSSSGSNSSSSPFSSSSSSSPSESSSSASLLKYLRGLGHCSHPVGLHSPRERETPSGLGFWPPKMVADRGKKSKVADRTQDEHSDRIDTDLVLSIEKLQEVQDDLDNSSSSSAGDAPDQIVGLLAEAGYRVQSSELRHVAQRLERLENVMVNAPAEVQQLQRQFYTPCRSRAFPPPCRNCFSPHPLMINVSLSTFSPCFSH